MSCGSLRPRSAPWIRPNGLLTKLGSIKKRRCTTWIDHNDKSVNGGLAFLNDLAEEAGESGWLAGSDKMSQADASGVVAYTFPGMARRKLGIADAYPALAAFAARMEATEEFCASPLP